MGCSQGKTTNPAVAKISTPAVATTSTNYVEPSNTLLTSVKGATQARELVALKKELASEELRDPAVTQTASKSSPLRSKALRIFVMAIERADGLLDASMLVDPFYSKMVQEALGADSPPLFSQTEWLEAVRQAADRDYDFAALFLGLCLTHLEDQKEHWPLREQALEVFWIGDRHNDGQLNMDELTEMRQSAEFADAMMGSADLDKSGTVSKGEWLAYIKRLADNDEQSAAAVLELYKIQLTRTSTKVLAAKTKEAFRTASMQIWLDGMVLDSKPVVNMRHCRWACC